MIKYLQRLCLLSLFVLGIGWRPDIHQNNSGQSYSSFGGEPGFLESGLHKGRLLSAEKQEETSPVALEDYWLLVEETLALVRSLEGTPPETAQGQLASMADEWVGVTAVTTPNNQTIRLNQAILETLLREDPPDLEALSARLEAMLATRASWPAAVHSAESLASLEQILSQEEFQWAEAEEEEAGQGNDWLARILEFLDRIFNVEVNVGGQTLGNLIGIVSAVVLAVALFFALRGLFLDFVVERELGEEGVYEDELLTAETALKRAQTLSTGGDYRMAVRYLYLSTLLILEERGLFRYDRAKTNREYLRSLKERPELAAILQDVVEVFDRVWYGFQPLSQADYSQYQNRVEALKRQQ